MGTPALHTAYFLPKKKNEVDPSEEQLSAEMVRAVKSSQGDPGSTESNISQKKQTYSSTSQCVRGSNQGASHFIASLQCVNM